MSRKWILGSGLFLIIVSFVGFYFKSSFSVGQAGVHIESNPQSVVYIDDQQVGTTPYDGVRESGEIVLKLVPQEKPQNSEWSARVNLVTGIKTVVRHDFGETIGDSAGEILSFEKINGAESALTIVSTPDAAQITLDGENRGFTPLPIKSLSEGDHKIVVTQPGYKDREIQARTYGGYKLTVIALLAQLEAVSDVQEVTESAVASVEKKFMVEVKDTPVGYLRVRSNSDKNSPEVFRLKIGAKVPFIDQTEDSQWFKVEYETGKEGWISSQYATKAEDSL